MTCSMRSSTLVRKEHDVAPHHSRATDLTVGALRLSRTVEQALPAGAMHGVEPGMGVELFQHAVYMIADRVNAQK